MHRELPPPGPQGSKFAQPRGHARLEPSPLTLSFPLKAPNSPPGPVWTSSPGLPSCTPLSLRWPQSRKSSAVVRALGWDWAGLLHRTPRRLNILPYLKLPSRLSGGRMEQVLCHSFLVLFVIFKYLHNVMEPLFVLSPKSCRDWG